MAGWDGCVPARPVVPSMPPAPPADRPPGPGIPVAGQPGAGIDLLEAALAVFGDDVEQVITVIDPADRPIRTDDRCAISERSAQSPDHGRPSRGHRLREKREKREKGVFDPGLIPLFGVDVDGSDPPGTPA